MGRIIVATGLAGWAGIVGLCWWMTYRRVVNNCVIRPTSYCLPPHQRELDWIVLVGLMVALAYFIICLCVHAVIKARRNDRPARRYPMDNQTSQLNP